MHDRDHELVDLAREVARHGLTTRNALVLGEPTSDHRPAQSFGSDDLIACRSSGTATLLNHRPRSRMAVRVPAYAMPVLRRP